MGFLTAVYAYTNHHNLAIRPEDVWFAILSQLGFFIKANSEELRNVFVQHEGQVEIKVKDHGKESFGALIERLKGGMAKYVNDADLDNWIMPSFSTTTETDRVVASVLFMGAMQKYFLYSMQFRCGIPAVTLLGEASDWQDILSRLDKIDKLGEEPMKYQYAQAYSTQCDSLIYPAG